MAQTQTSLRGYRCTCSPLDDDTVCWVAPGQKRSMLGGPGWRAGSSLGTQGHSAGSFLWEMEGGRVGVDFLGNWLGHLHDYLESHRLEATENPAGLSVEPVQPPVVLLKLEGKFHWVSRTPAQHHKSTEKSTRIPVTPLSTPISLQHPLGHCASYQGRSISASRADKEGWTGR